MAQPTELSPAAKRMKIDEPQIVPVEQVHWSDPELRNEVRVLRAKVASIEQQQQETRGKHNLLLQRCYTSFKGVHERRLETEQGFAEVKGVLVETDRQLGIVRQAIDHGNAERVANLTEQLEAFKMMREELERFKFDVFAKAVYVETTLVPQAL